LVAGKQRFIPWQGVTKRNSSHLTLLTLKNRREGRGEVGRIKREKKKMRWLLKTVLDEFRTLVMLNFHW
jgi:hypothetical protein